VDRAKDLIKSGGEWISSVDIENQLMAHPNIAEAAVVAAPHPRWQERPLAYVVAEAGESVPMADKLRAWLAEYFVKWWLPDDFVTLTALPRTGVGKVDKRELREISARHFVDDEVHTDQEAANK
jgi:fatty-acyl-CoA synthase